MKISQSLKQTQNLMITPQLQQAIKLLTIPHLEMIQVVNKELTENPLLEEIDSEVSQQDNNEVDYKIEQLEMQNKELTSDQITQDELVKGGKDEFDWNNYLEKNNPNSLSSSAPNTNKNNNTDPDNSFNYENIISREKNLTEHLNWQLGMHYLLEEEQKFAELIIFNLNEDGYLETSLDEILNNTQLKNEDALEMMKMIQNFDPVGCASTSLQECLLVQARTFYPNNKILNLLLSKYFNNLNDSNFIKHISRQEKINEEQIEKTKNIILTLNPKPGKLISSDNTQYIIPDLYVHQIGNKLIATLNDEGVPKLKISNYYQSIINKNSFMVDNNAKEFIQNKLRSAEWLLKSMHNRQKTILKVGEAIIKFQKDFFINGPGNLKPMILKDIANEINMHESTVSRVTINKYMHTPIGTFELKYFFGTGIGSKNGGVDISSESLKTKIKQLINLEDIKKPLSDQKIVEILSKDAINIARRTVAKYREMMGIPSSSKRKKT
jgi:RNA polymerase sigma-54 factor